MVTGVARFAPLAIYAFKVLKKLHDLYAESTPQERDAIKDQLQAIYDILRKVAGRGQEASDLPPMLMLPPPETLGAASEVRDHPKRRFRDRSRRFRQDIRQFTRIIGKYQSNFTAEEAKQIMEHLNEVRKILSAIDRRTKN